MSFLLCRPTPWSFSAASANNVWMAETEDRSINYDLAHAQWRRLYAALAALDDVFLLPVPKWAKLQDQVYVANLGAVIPESDAAVVSHFKAPERVGESVYGARLFDSLGFSNDLSPYTFEGEAELKRVAHGLYIGGYGQRTDERALGWIADRYRVDVIPVAERDERLYHLDCSVLPVCDRVAAICTHVLSQSERKRIERHVDIIDVPYNHAKWGATNSIVVRGHLLTASHVVACDAGSEEYANEKGKLDWLERAVCAPYGLELDTFNLSEFLKSGALLSCLVMNLYGAAG